MPAAFGTCYETADLAAQAHCTDAYPVSAVDAAGMPVVVSCAGTQAGGVLNLERAASEGTTAYSMAPAYPDCSLTDITRAMPSTDTLATAATFGLSAVLVSYLAAVAVGMVLRLLK